MRIIAHRWSVSKTALIRHRNAHTSMSVGTPGATETIPEDAPPGVPDPDNDVGYVLHPSLRHVTTEEFRAEIEKRLKAAR